MGYAWIQYKVEKSFTSSKEAQKEMDSGTIPAIIGPGNFFFIVDDHHTLCALDYSGYSSTSVTLDVICDKRNLSIDAFWEYMAGNDLAYLGAHPTNEPDSLPISISYSQLPQSFSFTKSYISFSDDPWRSMAGFSRKVTAAAAPAPSCSSSDNKYCERCMFRGCEDGYKTSGGGVSYFEFRWSYFMNDATFYATSYWPSPEALSAFLKAYQALSGSQMGKYNTDDWFTAANQVVSLCRSAATAAYVVPKKLYPGSSTLPGYYSGYTKLPADPDCSSPVCL